MNTKERILEAAGRLFAERGFAGTSLRSLTAEAGVNLAAVNYHFGSKEGLFVQLVETTIAPVNEERLRLLDALESRGDERPPALEELVEAFIGPALRVGARKDESGLRLLHIMGRMNVTDIGCAEELRAVFRHVEQRFVPALRRVLPDLSPSGFFWRLHFMLCVMCMTLFDPDRIRVVSANQCDPDDVEATLRHMVDFVTGGLRAAEHAAVRPAGEARGE